MRPCTFPGTTNVLLLLAQLIGLSLPSLAQGVHDSSCVESDEISLLQVSARPSHRPLKERAFAGFRPAVPDDSTYLPRDSDATWIHPAVSEDVTYLPRDDDDTWIPAEMSTEGFPEADPFGDLQRSLDLEIGDTSDLHSEEVLVQPSIQSSSWTDSSLFDKAVERRLKKLDASIQSDKAVVASQYDEIPEIISGINNINNLSNSVAQTAQATKNVFGPQTATPEARPGAPQPLPGQSWAQPPAQYPAQYPAQPPPAQPPPAPPVQPPVAAPSLLSTMLQNPAMVAMAISPMVAIIILCACGCLILKDAGWPGAGDASTLREDADCDSDSRIDNSARTMDETAWTLDETVESRPQQSQARRA